MAYFELQRAADKLIRDIFAVKKDEVVVITADTGSDMELVNAVASSAYSAGAKPYGHYYRYSVRRRQGCRS